MFIRVTSIERGPLLINTDFIICIVTYREGTCLFLSSMPKQELIVRESMEQIESMIRHTSSANT